MRTPKLSLLDLNSRLAATALVWNGVGNRSQFASTFDFHAMKADVIVDFLSGRLAPLMHCTGFVGQVLRYCKSASARQMHRVQGFHVSP